MCFDAVNFSLINATPIDASRQAVYFLGYLASGVIFLNVLTGSSQKSLPSFKSHIRKNFVLLCASLKSQNTLEFVSTKLSDTLFYDTSKLQARSNNFSLNLFSEIVISLKYNLEYDGFPTR